jgi:phosphatidylglycerol:prolipoprotein diacylglycerol transferase
MFPVIRIGPAAIQSSALVLITALWLSAWVAERECKRRGLSGEEAWNVIALAVAVTVLVARLAYVAQNFSAYTNDWLQVLAPTPTTLSLDFGAIFGFVAALAYAQRRQIPIARFLDALAPGMLIALAIFAFGQFLTGDAYGAPANLPWAIPLWGESRHPVQLYDALGALIGFMVVWRMRVQLSRDGLAALSAITWYSAARLFVDAFRGDAALLPGGYRATQVIALFVLLTALWGVMQICTAIGMAQKNVR